MAPWKRRKPMDPINMRRNDKVNSISVRSNEKGRKSEPNPKPMVKP